MEEWNNIQVTKNKFALKRACGDETRRHDSEHGSMEDMIA